MSEPTQQEERRIVVTYNPARRRRQMIMLALAVGLAALLLFQAGHYLSRVQLQSLQAQLEASQQQAERGDARIRELQLQLSSARIAATVDKQSVELVRAQVFELESVLADLRKELTFYKGMMAPEDIEKGLKIDELELQSLNGSGKWAFNLVIQQLATIHRLQKGSAVVEVLGVKDGKAIRYALKDLSEEIVEHPIKLRFKYFQNIEAELELPQGFEPLSVEVSAKTTGKKAQHVKRTFDWLPQEGQE